MLVIEPLSASKQRHRLRGHPDFPGLRTCSKVAWVCSISLGCPAIASKEGDLHWHRRSGESWLSSHLNCVSMRGLEVLPLTFSRRLKRVGLHAPQWHRSSKCLDRSALPDSDEHVNAEALGQTCRLLADRGNADTP